jgi:UDP-N-acetylmuramoyl-tripeptide--D-alanyl-D-alanine ligase
LGKQARLVRRGALSAGMPASRVIVGGNHAHIARIVRKEMRSGDWILFKGSRGMRMEKVLAAVKVRGA